MLRNGKRFFIILLFTAVCGTPAVSNSAVVVHDDIAVINKEVRITAQTKGGFFAKGGQLVEFIVNDRSLGTVLSGGDGYAYKTFVPRGRGLQEVIARHGDDKGKGALLSLPKGSSMVFIDFEGALLRSFFSEETIRDSRHAIGEIKKKYPVVYLQSEFMGLILIKEWLRENEFPESVVLPLGNGAVFDNINRKGFRIKAVVGGKKLIDAAAKYKAKAFSFEDIENAIKVNNWEELEKSIK